MEAVALDGAEAPADARLSCVEPNVCDVGVRWALGRLDETGEKGKALEDPGAGELVVPLGRSGDGTGLGEGSWGRSRSRLGLSFWLELERRCFSAGGR